jgi:hypothetical protein
MAKTLSSGHVRGAMGRPKFKNPHKIAKEYAELQAIHEKEHPAVLIRWTCRLCYPIPDQSLASRNSTIIRGGLKRYNNTPE